MTNILASYMSMLPHKLSEAGIIMSDSELKVECGTHGERVATFLCKHLVESDGRGFNVGYDPENPNDVFPDAWCNECEAVLEREGEWNDTSEKFADIKMLCSSCYQDIRKKNWIQDEDALRNLIMDSFSYLNEKQKTFMNEFKINDHERWDWYQESGLLILSHEGKPQVEAEISFSGSVSTLSDTWMWAWASESLEDKIKSDSLIIRDIGEQEQYLKLASALWSADEVDGWEMTSIMAKEYGAIGAYRTPSDSGFTYMIVKSAKWVNS